MAIKKIKNPKYSAKYYNSHPEAKRKKAAYDTKLQSTPAQKKKKRELSKKRYELKKKVGASKLKGKDLSHQPNGSLKLENLSKNRGNSTNTKGDRKSRGKKICKK